MGWLQGRGRAPLRAGPKSDPSVCGALRLESAGGTGVPARPPPPERVPTGSGLPALPAPPFIKRTDNKRRVGAEKWGRGDSKSSKSFRVRGPVFSSRPPTSNFCGFLKVTPELDPDAIQALTAHTAAQSCLHTCIRRIRYTETRTAPPLSFPNSRVTVQIEGNAAVPLRFPGRAGVPTGSLPRPPSLLRSALPAQVSPRYAFTNASEQTGGNPATEPAGMEHSAEGPGERTECISPIHPWPGLFSAASQP